MDEYYINRLNNSAIELWNIPDKYRTHTVCLCAVKKNRNSLYYVPDKLKTAEICAIVIKGYSEYSDDYLPKNRNIGFCLELVKNGVMVEWIIMHANWERRWCLKEELYNSNFLYDAMKYDGNAIKYIPKEMITYELCLEAAKNKGNILNYLTLVNKDFVTYELCMITIKEYNYINNIPEKYVFRYSHFHKLKYRSKKDYKVVYDYNYRRRPFCIEFNQLLRIKNIFLFIKN